METYYSFQKSVTFMYFWLDYCDENHHIERIPVAVKNIDHLFSLAGEMIKDVNLHLFSLSDSTRIDDNEYLEQIQKLLVYFELTRYFSLKNISYPLNINYFL